MFRISRHVRPRITHYRNLGTTPDETTREHLRVLLRETAQPVAVITSFMPDSQNSSTHHGATLSSFTSIAMDPYPLVSFSLRIPSRMATTLKAAESSLDSHMVINILSAAQESTAVQFSRPDLYPEPFSIIPHMLSEEGLPVLKGSLGALSCKLIKGSWPLHDLESIENGGVAEGMGGAETEKSGVASELFLARVVRVETLPLGGEDRLQALPLLYHRRGYATTSDRLTPVTKS